METRASLRYSWLPRALVLVLNLYTNTSPISTLQDAKIATQISWFLKEK